MGLALYLLPDCPYGRVSDPPLPDSLLPDCTVPQAGEKQDLFLIAVASPAV